MKANSLDELVTNSNIAGELRNYTDWHTRLVKFAQLVADWQKEQMLKDAVEGEAEELYNDGESQCTVGVGTYFKPGEKVYVLKAEEE